MDAKALLIVGIGVGAWMWARQSAAAQQGQPLIDESILDARDAWARDTVAPIDNTVWDARDAWAQYGGAPEVDEEGGFFSGLGNVIGDIFGIDYWGDQMRWTEAKIPAHYLQPIRAAETQYGLPRNLLARLLWQESRYNANAVNKYSGAQGIAQFMPATAREFGIDPFNALQAIDAAGKYLKQLYGMTGSWLLALAAYNWGIGNVQRKGIARAPTETRNYYTQILADIGMPATTA